MGCVAGWAVSLELKVDAPIEKLQIKELIDDAKAGAFVAVVTPFNYLEILSELHNLALEGTSSGGATIVSRVSTRFLEAYASQLFDP